MKLSRKTKWWNFGLIKIKVKGTLRNYRGVTDAFSGVTIVPSVQEGVNPVEGERVMDQRQSTWSEVDIVSRRSGTYSVHQRRESRRRVGRGRRTFREGRRGESLRIRNQFWSVLEEIVEDLLFTGWREDPSPVMGVSKEYPGPSSNEGCDVEGGER